MWDTFTLENRFKQILSSAISKVLTKLTSIGTEAFTLDTFSNITFHPVSVVKIRFVNRFVVFLCLLFILFFIAIIEGLFSNLHYKTGGDFFGVIDYYEIESVWLCLGIVTFCLFFIAKSLIKKLKYKLNADYIEASFVNNEIVRIARKSRWVYLTKVKIKSFYLQFILILRSSTNSTY